MATYRVEVCRIGYSAMLLEVEAKSYKRAQVRALEDAPSLNFREHDADYVLGDEPTEADKLRGKVGALDKQLDMILDRLKDQIPLLLGMDKGLDKRLVKILRKG